jgi:hypothetical protein
MHKNQVELVDETDVGASVIKLKERIACSHCVCCSGLFSLLDDLWYGFFNRLKKYMIHQNPLNKKPTIGIDKSRKNFVGLQIGIFVSIS